MDEVNNLPLPEGQDKGLVPAEGARPMNAFQHFLGIFASPKQTLESIAAHPTWVVPVVILLLAAMVFAQLTIPAILADVESSGQLEKIIEQRNLTPEQAEAAREMQRTQVKSFGIVGAGIGFLLFSVIGAAIVLFVGNIILAGKANFRQVFAVYVWSGLVTLISYIIRVPLSLQQMTMKIYFSPAVLLPVEMEQSFIFKVAAALDIFMLWRVALLALGFAAVYRFGLGKAFGTIGGLYLLVAVLSSIFAGLFGF